MRRLRSLKPDTLLVAAFFATLPLYSPNFSLFQELLGAPEELATAALYAMVVSTLVVGAIFVVGCALRQGSRFVKAPCVVAGAVFLLVGFIVTAFAFGLDGTGGLALAVIGGVLLGAGTVAVGVAWGVCLAGSNLREALVASALAVGITTLLRMGMLALPTVGALVAFAVLAVVGVIVPCVKAVRGTLAESEGRATVQDEEIARVTSSVQPAPSVKGLAGSVMRMAQVAGMAFVGLLFFSFVSSSRAVYVSSVVSTETVCSLIAAVLVLLLGLIKLERPLMSFIYRLVMPVFALALMLLGAFPYGSVLQELGSASFYVLFSGVSILALATLCAMAHAREFSPALIFSATIASYALFAIIGLLCGSTDLFSQESGGGEAMLAVTTCYYIFIVAVPVVQAWLAEGADEASEPAANDIQERCARVAAAHGLTPRETEVLSYLGRGHGMTYTAESLVISESTVRSHAKSIYRKLDVSSREELLRLIDES